MAKLNNFMPMLVSLLRRFKRRRQASDLNNERLRGAIDTLQEGFALYDANDRLVEINDAFRRIVPAAQGVMEKGGTYEDLLRINVNNGLLNKAIGREEEYIQERLKQHRDSEEPIILQVSDSWYMLKESATPEGGCALTFSDITELRKAEDALRKSEALFRAVVNHSPAKIHITDSDGRYTLINKVAEKLLGVTDEEGRGKTPYEFFPKDIADAFMDHDRAAIVYGKSIEEEEEFTLEDGVHTFLTVKFPIFDLDGVTAVGAIGTDITERRRAEASQKATEESVRAIISNLLDGVITITEKGVTETFNSAAERIFGYSADEIIGKNVSLLIPGLDQKNHDRYIKNFLQTGDAKIIGKGREVVGLKKDGTEFPIHLSISELKMAEWGLDERRDTRRRRFIGTVRDLTEQKQTESVLRRSQKMEAVGKLSGGIAHDFNNLLSIVIGNLDLLTRLTKEDEKLQAPVVSALNAALRGARLTKRLLGFSQESQGVVNPTDINKVIKGMDELLSKSLTVEIKTKLNLGKGLWLSEIDDGELEDALMNLSLNARDAMPDGGTFIIETANITFDSEYAGRNPDAEPGDYVEISVSDTGLGISDDIIDRIFEPFFTTKDADKGTGLGLSMVYGFVKRSKGHIKVFSAPDGGATIKLYLPKTTEALQAGNLASKAEDLPGGGETILAVDDEEDLATLTKFNLEQLGYKVLIAHDAEKALEILKQKKKIDLLFTDVVMPGGLNGYELAQEATGLKPGLKVLISSGYSGKRLLNEKSSKLFSKMIRKPYRYPELAQKIRQTLDSPN